MPTSRPWSVRHDGRVRRRRGRRGEGTVYPSDGGWIARFPLGTVNGKRMSKRVRCATEADANLELARLRRIYGAGGNPAIQPLGQYLIEWLAAHRDVRDSTRASYETHIRVHISPLLGGIPLVKVRPADVRRLIDQLVRKGKAPGYIHLVIRTLSVALNAAVNDRSITDNATRGVRLPRIERDPIRALTGDGADAILEAVTGHWVELPVRVWMGTGLRRGEVLGLDQGDLQLDKGFVHVRISKTFIRAVPANDDAIEALRLALAAAPRRGKDEPVFYSPRTGDRMRGDSITHALPRLLEAAGLGHLTPHALRHGAATLMLTGGAQMRVIAEQLGHRNPAITARLYAHVVPESQRSAVGLLDRPKRSQGPT